MYHGTCYDNSTLKEPRIMDHESAVATEVLAANRRLLESIVEGDWATYTELCDPTLTAFEPESRGCLAEGMDFHHFYFKLDGAGGPYNITVSARHVRLLGDDVAVISCVRLVQRLGSDGKPATSRSEETRIWQRQGGAGGTSTFTVRSEPADASPAPEPKKPGNNGGLRQIFSIFRGNSAFSPLAFFVKVTLIITFPVANKQV